MTAADDPTPPAASSPVSSPEASEPHPVHILELGHLKPAMMNGLRLLLETVVIPTMLLYAFMLTVGEIAGLIAVLGWCALVVAMRMATMGRVPGTLMLCGGMLIGRATIALATSSVYVYLLQPVAGSVFMALLFLGSALIGRPITKKLAQDFVAFPAHLIHDLRVSRMFTQVAFMWGGSRLLDAAVSIAVLHWGLKAGVFSRGVVSGSLTVLSVAACSYWGWSRLRRIEGLEFRFGSKPDPVPPVAAELADLG